MLLRLSEKPSNYLEAKEVAVTSVPGIVMFRLLMMAVNYL